MKILIISSGVLPLPPVNGGAVENLIDMILNDNEITGKYDLTIYSIANDEAIKKSKNYKKCQFKFIDKTNIKYKIKRIVRGIINRFPKIYIGNAYISEVIKMEDFSQYDYIIIENVPEYAIPISKKCKNKLILHLHNDRLNSNTKNAKKILKLYSKVFSLSNYVSEKVRNIYPLKENKVYTLYNGIDIEKFGKEKYLNNIDETRLLYNIGKKDKVLLYAGRIVPEKGVLELIEAFCNIKNKTNIKLLITGSVNYRENNDSAYLRKIKKLLKNNDKIVFTGYIDYEKMPSIYAVADIGIVPSLWEEPFALTVIEHMASGNPVIITDSGGMKELVNEKCAIEVKRNQNLVSNLKNAMEELLESEQKINLMGNEARNQSKRFRKEIYINKFEKLIKGINENEY